MPDLTPVELPFPVRGIDRAQPRYAQPAQTCPDALNVRGFPPSSRRLGGGKRGGLIRAIPAITGQAQRKITQLAQVVRFPTVAPSTSGRLEAVSDDFLTYTSNASGVESRDLLGNYVVFRKRPDQEWVLGPEAPSGTGTGATRALVRGPSTTRAKTVLFLDTTNDDTAGDTGLAVAYPTTNDITATFFCDTKVTTPLGEQDGCSNVGPFVRGSNDLKRKVVAYLEFTGVPNGVRLVIDRLTETGRTRLATSTRQSILKGENAEANRVIGPIIRIRANSNTITASVTWDAGVAGGIADELTVTDTTDASNTRAGVVIIGNSPATRRALWRLEYTRRVPYEYAALAEFNATAQRPAANQFLLPADLSSSAGLISDAATTVNTGAATYASVQAFPTMDTAAANRRFDATAANSQARTTRSQLLLRVAGAQPGQTPVVDVLYRRDATSLLRDTANVVFRATSGHRYMIRVELDRDYVSGTGTLTFGQATYTRIRLVAIFDNAGTRTRKVIYEDTINPASPSGSTLALPTFPLAAAVRWQHTDTGVNNGGRITASVNGMQLWSLDYSNDSDWTGAPAPSGQLYGSSLGIEVSDEGTETNPAGFNIVNIASPSYTLVTEGTDTVIFSDNRVDVGTLGSTLTPTPVTYGLGTVGLTGYPEFGTIKGLIYAVDGSISRVIDPVNKSINEWLNVSGTDLDKCQLALSWRGRMVLARQYDKKRQWYMSAVNDPLNWNFGDTESLATRAYSGSNAEIGQPGDEITALIAPSDDVLVFGCASSLWVLRGDPGAGGRLDLLSDETGVLGPRAYCFDELGNLYFMGSGGLYVMPRGATEYQNVLGRRIDDWLRSIDPAKQLIHMAFDALTRCVHVFVTPRTGNDVGTHLAYDIGANAAWLDQYPIGVGPWSVAQIGGQAGEDRRFLLGGRDGTVRRPSEDATSDDGSPIESFVRYPVLEAGQGQLELFTQDLYGFGVSGSGSLTWSWMLGDSAEDVCQQPVSPPPGGAVTGSWDLGRTFQRVQTIRRAEGAHQLALYQKSATDTWAMEKVVVTTRPGGRRRA